MGYREIESLDICGSTQWSLRAWDDKIFLYYGELSKKKTNIYR